MTGQIIGGELEEGAKVVLTRKLEVGYDAIHGEVERFGRIQIPGFFMLPYADDLVVAGWNIEIIKETP